jgi:hypothetical protein
MVEKAKDLIAIDARFTTRYIAKFQSYNSQKCFKNEKDKCQMDTPSPYKTKQNLARVRIVETDP